jgi:site-specific recombinase XerD
MMNTKKTTTRKNYKYTKWYDRMIEAMQLQSFSPRTQQSYVRAVRKLAEFYDKSPARITEEELCQYFLHRKNVDQWSSTACRIALCGIKFFYQKTLNRKWTKAKLIKPKKDKTLPVILSVSEVREVLKAIQDKQRFNHYAILATMYSCGLRLGEVIPLKVTDVQSKRGFLHVRGKGAKDRYVPLPPRTLQILRMNWVRHRNPAWLFPSPGRGGQKESIATEPMHFSRFQQVLKEAVREAKVHPKTRPHTFRHCYATHLMEQGVDIRVIQVLLGHSSLTSTMIYTRLTEPALKPATDIINKLMEDI